MAWVVYLQMHEKQQEHHQPSMFLWKHGNRLEVYKNCCLNTNFYHLRQYSNKASPQLICQHLIYYTRQKKKMIIDTRDNSSGKCLTYIPNNVKKNTNFIVKKIKGEYTRNHDCKNLKKQYWKRLEVETLDIINISQLQFTFRIYKHQSD